MPATSRSARSVTLVGSANTVIQGNFLAANGLASGASVADFLQSAPGYSGSAGNGVTITADNVTLRNITVTGFLTGIELGDGIDHTLIKDVTLTSSVFGINKSTTADVNDLTG